MYFGYFIDFDEIIRRIEEVNAQNLIQLAQEFFQSGNVAVTILGNLNGLRLTKSQLEC
jgi:predicted Zn-dependent peptidase